MIGIIILYPEKGVVIVEKTKPLRLKPHRSTTGKDCPGGPVLNYSREVVVCATCRDKFDPRSEYGREEGAELVHVSYSRPVELVFYLGVKPLN